MSQDNPHSYNLDNIWEKGMAKNADPENVREEVDSLSDGGRFVDIEPIEEPRKG